MSVTHVKVDAYTETGGTFPVTVDRRSDTSEEVRVGDAELPLSGNTRLLGLVEGVHRFGGSPPAVRGTIIGQSFSLPAGDTTNTWGRVGVGVEHRLSDSALFSANLNASSRGGHAQFSGGVGVTVRF